MIVTPTYLSERLEVNSAQLQPLLPSDTNSPKELVAAGGWGKWLGQLGVIEHSSSIEGLIKIWSLWVLDF